MLKPNSAYASDIINPLTRVAFVYNGPKRMELAPNSRYSGGSKRFDLILIAVSISFVKHA